MRRSKLKTHAEALAGHLRDSEYRAEWERTQFAHDVAVMVIGFRVEHGLSQRALAERLGMKQPAIARLEAGEVTPTIDTLAKLSRGLGLDFRMAITPTGVKLTA